ncbi:MAG: hypothetical protein L6R37_002688 [Teloschistes peruensis]|nr:MAG: hypothetical protein L6R37_002688 [Teloschistes peruensis]
MTSKNSKKKKSKAKKPRTESYFDYGREEQNLESNLKSADAYAPPSGGLMGFMEKISDGWAGRDKDADEKEWEKAHQFDPTVGAENLFEDSDEPSSGEAAETKYRERKKAGGRLLIDDQEIYQAWEEGPYAVQVLIDREHHAILTVYGKPAKRTITEEDLAVLYTQYEKRFTESGHQVGECKDCEDKGDGKYASFSITKKPRLDLDHDHSQPPDTLWHFTSNSSFPAIKKAYRKYQKAHNGFGKQKEKAPLIAENEKRESQGKKPIPLHETRVERIIRELAEGARVAPYIAAKGIAEKFRAEEEAARAREEQELEATLTRNSHARKTREEENAASHAEMLRMLEELRDFVSFSPKCLLTGSSSRVQV